MPGDPPEQQTLLPQYRSTVPGQVSRHAIPRRPVPGQLEREPAQVSNGDRSSKQIAAMTAKEAELTLHAGSDETKRHVSSSLWQPIWLSNAVLISFMVLFSALAAALIVLWRVNTSEDGFSLTASKNPLSWRYGPTAVLVVVLSLWRQVDYHCKIMQPWQHLEKSPSTAPDSVMLDYLSPLNVKSFARAIRLRHYPLVASIAGFALLKLIILVSTGLLDLRSTNLERNYQITLTKTFDGSAFWTTVTANSLYTEGPPQWLSTYNNVSSYSVTANLGILDKNSSGLATSSDLTAFQTFEVPSTFPAKTIWADLDVFLPNVSCEIAETVFDTIDDDGIPKPRYQFRSNTCSTGSKDIDSSICLQSFERCPPAEIVYAVGKVNCSEVPGQSEGYTPNFSVATPYDIRYALFVLNITYEPTADVSTVVMPVPHQISAVICKTDYSISKTKVSYENDTAAYTIDASDSGNHLANLSATMLGEIMWSALRDTNGLYTNASLIKKRTTVSDAGQSNVRDPLFQTVLRSLDGNHSIADLLSSETLQEGATKAYEGIAAQLMKNSFLLPINDTITASGTYVDERLQIGQVSLWIMFAGFVIMIILAFVIMFTLSRECVLHDPGSLAAHAIILSSSPDLHQLLRSAGRLRTSELGALLERYKFRASKEGYLQQIHVSRGPVSTAPLSRPKPPKSDSWTPTAARYHMIALAVIIPLIVIVVLEVLSQISNRHEGIADITGREETARYISRYLSALIMLLVAAIFSALDFTIASFAPYTLLGKGGIPARLAMRLNILGKLPPVALVHSLNARQFGCALANIAAIVGSVLTIISAGLWEPGTIIQHRPVTASLVDHFDTAWSNSSGSGDAGAVVTLNQIQHGSASLPSTIWNDFVMPRVSSVRADAAGQQPVIAGSESQNITLSLDSLLPELSCEVLDDEYVSIEWTPSQDRVFGVMTITGSAPISAQCGSSGNVWYNVQETIEPLDGHVSWLGGFFDLHTSASTFGEGRSDLDNISDNPAGCPSIGVIFGKTQEDKTTKSAITALVCSQKIHQVQLDVTYGGSNTGSPLIKQSVEPVPRWDNARYLTNGTPGIETFPYRVQKYLATGTGGGLGTDGTLTIFNPNSERQYLDQFLNHVVYGPNGTSLEDLSGIDNRQTLIHGVQTLYNKYMSLVIDMKFRTSDTARDRLAHGTLATPISRLKMNETSKLVLQICLGIMTLFGVAAFLVTDLRSTLPRNPCSIASTMGFLAGSELCGEEKHLLGLSGKEVDNAFEGWVVSLGWWEQSSKAERTVQEVASAESHSGDPESTMRRFGVDVGMPAQLGFREERWKLKGKWPSLRRGKR